MVHLPVLKGSGGVNIGILSTSKFREKRCIGKASVLAKYAALGTKWHDWSPYLVALRLLCLPRV